MANRKSDDYVVRMPAINLGNGEEEPMFGQRSSRPNIAIPNGLTTLTSTIQDSPGASILAYCLASISMTVVNKYVVSGTSWNLNFLYLAIQSIIGTVTILLCKQLGLIKDLASFNKGKARTWFPISLLLVAMIYTGTKALQFLTVPVYTIFKNLTIIVIAYGEVLWFGGSVSKLALLSFGLMVLSSVVAAWADIQHAVSVSKDNLHSSTDLSMLNVGYAWMGMNVLCAASYTLSVRKVTQKTSFKNWDLMFYNNLLSIPTLVIFSLAVEDWSAENLQRNFPVDSRYSLCIGIVYSGLAAIFISYSTAWCIRATSSTTYAMVGALNKLPLAIVGIIFFAAPVTFGSTTAILLGFISGLVYTWAKIARTQQSAEYLPVNSRRT